MILYVPYFVELGWVQLTKSIASGSRIIWKDGCVFILLFLDQLVKVSIRLQNDSRFNFSPYNIARRGVHRESCRAAVS